MSADGLRLRAYARGVRGAEAQPPAAQQQSISQVENMAVIGIIEAVIKEYQAPDFSIAFSGTPVYQYHVEPMVRSNMKKMCLAILIVPVLLMPLMFGRGTGAYLPQVTAILGLMIVLGSMALLSARLNKALDYVDTRLPTARSLLLLRNGKTVVEKYFWRGGPKATDYLHSLNLPLLQVLIGIACDHQLILGPDQPLAAFFPNHLTPTRFNGTAPLTLGHLLRAQAPLLWGAGNPDYWDLFYAADRIEASLRVIFRKQTGNQPALNFAASYLLSEVIERVSGQSVFNFAYRYLFQPLGITTYAAADDDLSHDPLVGFMFSPPLCRRTYWISSINLPGMSSARMPAVLLKTMRAATITGGIPLSPHPV